MIYIYGIIGNPADGLDDKTIVEAIDASEGDLVLRVSSPGGLVMAGLAIRNAIERVKAAGRKVIVHIDSLAASMASVIAMSGDEIHIADTAKIMIHDPHGAMENTAADFRRAAEQLEASGVTLSQIYASRTGMSVKAVAAMMAATTWFTAAEAVENGFATNVVETMQISADIRARIKPIDVTAFGFAQVPTDPLIINNSAKQPDNVLLANATLKEKTVNIAQILAFAAANKVSQDLQVKALSGELTYDQMVAKHNEAVAAANVALGTGVSATAIARVLAYAKAHKVDDALRDKALTGEIAFEALVDQHTDALALAEQNLIQTNRNGDGNGGGDLSPSAEADLRAEALAYRVLSDMGRQVKALEGRALQFVNDDVEDAARFVIRANGGTDAGLKSAAVMDRAVQIQARGGDVSSTDISLLLNSVVNVVFRDGYQAMSSDTTFQEWADEQLLPDFREVKSVHGGVISGIADMAEGEPFPLGKLGAGQSFVQLQTRGIEMHWTRQARLADQNNFNMFARTMRTLGMVFKQDEEAIAVKALTNPVMKTENGLEPIFSEEKGNLIIASALDIPAMRESKLALRKQKNKDGYDIGYTPRYLVVSADLAEDAEALTTVIAATVAGNVNVNAKLGLKIIVINGLPDQTAFLTDRKELAAIIAALRLLSDPGLKIIPLDDPRRQAVGFCAYNDFAAKGVNDKGWVKIEIA